MFLHLSVILFTREEGVHPPGRHTPWADTPPRRHPTAQKDCPKQTHSPQARHPRTHLSRQTPPLGRHPLPFTLPLPLVLSLGYVFINCKNNRGIWFA